MAIARTSTAAAAIRGNATPSFGCCAPRVLREIATALSANPTWTLRIDGHTDNIGGERFNLDLSRRRAASVKQALTGHYKVAPARLSTSGFGAGRPKETNGTLAGRARNRRVELIRQP